MWTPPPLSVESCFSPTPAGFEVFSALTQDEAGAYDSGPPETWTGSEWTGTNGIGDFGAGQAVMSLDWERVPGGYEFYGTYRVSAGAGSTTALGGLIEGTATPRAGDLSSSQWDIQAQLTITEAAGKYAGRSGDGEWSSTAAGDWAMPPSAQQGTFRFFLSPE